MKRSPWHMRLLACLVVGASLPPGRAGAQDRRWEVSPEAGYLFGGNFISDRDSLGKRISGTLQNAGVYGLRAGFLVSPNWALEIQASRTDARFELTESATRAVSSFRTDTLVGSAVRRFEVAGSFPYLSIGAGAARLAPSPGRAETRFTAAIGAGVEKFLYPWLGFRLDGRVFTTRLGGSTLEMLCTVPESADGTVPARPCRGKTWLTNSDVTAGLVFAF